MDKTKINISFDKLALDNFWVGSAVRKCIIQTLRAEQVTAACEINVLITDDACIRGINQASRGIDKATDVLSFPMFNLTPGQLPDDWSDYIDPESGRCPLGDIAISLERATQQAKEYGHSLRREVGYLTIHSVLHLLGYDHMDEGEQKKQMRRREETIASTIRGLHR